MAMRIGHKMDGMPKKFSAELDENLRNPTKFFSTEFRPSYDPNPEKIILQQISLGRSLWRLECMYVQTESKEDSRKF